MSSFRHILLPLDFTAKNEVTLDLASELAGHHKSRLTLLHVIETVDLVEGDEIQQFYDSLESAAQTNLAERAKRLIDEGRIVGQDIVFGRRALEIVRYAAENDVDLVVLNAKNIDEAHPLSGIAGLSYQVSIACPVTVLLAK